MRCLVRCWQLDPDDDLQGSLKRPERIVGCVCGLRKAEENIVDEHSVTLHDLLRRRGQTYRLMGSYLEALTDFNRAIELRPDIDWAVAERGETYRLMGRYEEALADFNQALELNPRDHWAIAS